MSTYLKKETISLFVINLGEGNILLNFTEFQSLSKLFNSVADKSDKIKTILNYNNNNNFNYLRTVAHSAS